MSISLIVNGTPYTEFMSASCTVSLETLANDFSFTASSVRGIPPFKYRDIVEVRVDGVTKVTAPITGITGQESEGAHTVTYTGRDQTSDLLDSDINSLGDIASDKLTLKRLIELVIADIGSSVTVVDLLSAAPFNKAEDYIAPQVGDNAWDFLRRYAAKRQAILTSDGSGRVVITQAEPVSSGAKLQKVTGGTSINNILSQDWTIDNDKRFNKYIVKAQLDPLSLNFAGDTSTGTLAAQGGLVTDAEIPKGRQSVTVESKSYGNDELEDRALWAKQLAKAEALRYSCTVKGHSYPGTGKVWQENTLVLINSDAADISTEMLLNSATFSAGEGQPTITTLEFVEKNVYLINAKALAAKKIGKQNDAFF